MEDAIAVWKEEGREEGREEDRVEGIDEGIELLAKLLREGMPLDAAFEKAKKPVQ